MERPVERWLPITLAAIMTTVCLWRLFQAPEWIATHDLDRYPVLLDAFRESFLRGNLYPRWLPDLWGGYGFPTFVFYQPGYFFLALPFSLVVPDVVLATKITVFALLLSSIYGFFLLARRLTDWKTALFGALCFGFTPYIYVNLYVRGDLSELAGMLLTPWPLYFLVRLATARAGRVPWPETIGLTGSLALVILCHPATALFYVPAFGVFAIATLSDGLRPRAALVTVMVAACCAVALTAPYWLTTLQMRDAVHFDRLVEGYNQPHTHAVYFDQLFSRAFEFGSSQPDSADDHMSFQLGLPLCLLALTGLLLGHRSRALRAAFVVYAVLVLGMTQLAVPFWRISSLFRYTQFPWRLLSVIAVFQALCILGVAGLRRRGPSEGRYLWILAGAFVAVVAWNGNQIRTGGDFDPHMTAEGRRTRMAGFKTFANNNEFLPRTAAPINPKPRDGDVMVIAPPGVSVAPIGAADPHRIHYRVTLPGPSAEVFLQQIYFPGWYVELNGRPVPDARIRELLVADGRMRLALEGGRSHEILAYYAGVPGRRMRLLLSLLGLIVLSTYLVLYGRLGATSATDRARPILGLRDLPEPAVRK